MRDIYFLGGLPRSGNTLLSALLNQNPDIYVSPLSPLLDNVQGIEKTLNVHEASLSFDFESKTVAGLKHYVQGFYSDIKKPIVIDRNKRWGNKESIFTAIKYFTKTPKIIYTVRDIPSILTSFISLVNDTENNFIDKSLREMAIKPYGKQTQNDLRCDWLFNGQISTGLVTLTELLQIQIPVCLVEYDDLVANPQKELNDIYDFLELPHFINNVDNVEKYEKENLTNAGLPDSLHDVRKKVEKISLDPKSVLSPKTLQKYSDLEFWRN